MNTPFQDRPRVLIVDDQPNWLDVLYDLLDSTKYEIETATSYDEAKNKLKQRAFHVVVSDQRLVDEDETNIQGILLLDEIGEFQDGAKTIVVTGYPTVHSAREALRGHDAFDYMLKSPEGGGPFNIKEYRERVKEAAEEAMGERQGTIVRDLSLIDALALGVTYDQISKTLFYDEMVPPDASRSVEKVLSWLLYPLQPLAHQMGKAWPSEKDQLYEILCWSRNLGKATLIRIGKEKLVSESLKVKWFGENWYEVRKSDQSTSGPVAGVSHIIDEMAFDDFAALVEGS